MKQNVTLITCDDFDRTQATKMHEITLLVNGERFDFDACSQGCAVRLVHGKLIEVIEGSGSANLRAARGYAQTQDQHPDDPPEHPDDARMRLEDR